MSDNSQLRTVLEMMQKGGVFEPGSEEQMHQLLLQVMQFAGDPGADWDEFEDEDS